MGLRAQHWKARERSEFRPGGVYPAPHGLTGVAYKFVETSGPYNFDRKGACVSVPVGTSIPETGARLRLQGEVISKPMPRGSKNLHPSLYSAFSIAHMDYVIIGSSGYMYDDVVKALRQYSEIDFKMSVNHPFLQFAPKELKAVPAITNGLYMQSDALRDYARTVIGLDEDGQQEFASIIKKNVGRTWKRNVVDKTIEMQMLLTEPQKTYQQKKKIPDFDYGQSNSLAEALNGITFRVREIPLEMNLRRHFKVEHRAIEAGVVPRYMYRHPWGPVFDTIKKLKGGTVLIDNSGSMQLNVDEIVEMVKTAPLSTIAMYEGNKSTNIGYLTILGKDGRCATKERIARIQDGGHNIVDYHSLRWLAGMPEPRVWISDQNVTAVNASCPSVYKTACMTIVRQFGIYCAYDSPRALELFKRLHKDKVAR